MNGRSVKPRPSPAAAQASHTFTAPGLVGIQVFVTDATGDAGSDFIQHLVHHPLTAKRPTSATSIVYDAARKRVYSVNQDNDTLTSIDADKLQKVAELAVYRRPESLALTPEGKLWIVHQDDYAVAVVDPDRFVVERGFRLPYASQPVGVAMSPTGDAAYITLMAVGKLLKLDPRTGDVLGEAQVGPRPRGIAVSHDGKDVYVTRFISPDTGGEVVKVDAAAMTVATRILLKLDKETEDNDQRARGVPNYLFSVALTPDGRQAWIPGKKDNIVRGKLRDGRDITHDTTVRPLAAIVDTQSAQEIYASRIDLDDRSQPVHVDFSPYGNFAILTLGGSNRVEIRDINRPTQVFSAIGDVGTFPRAAVLAPDGHLFVQGALSRNVLVYDMSTMLETFAASTPPLLADIPAVASEKLSAQVLAGKKIFHDAEDTRMAFEGYLSCGGCHFEGDDDGRVYDFSTRGEGLRNTPALLGRKGTGHGRLNWTGTLDEVQDFEHQIRDLFDGTGLLADDVFHVGTRDQPLGDPKAGLSADLDALAAYVTSLDHVNPSPYRNPDGSLTADGVAGKAVFEKLGCDFCHGGAEFTDSARGMLARRRHHHAALRHARRGTAGRDRHADVARRLGDAALPARRIGADAARRPHHQKRRAICTGTSARCRRSRLISWSPTCCRSTASHAVHRFPFDPPWQGQGADGGITGGGERPGPIAGGCACAIPAGDQRTIPGSTYLGVSLLGLALVRRRDRVRSARATSAVLALLVLALLMIGCRPDGPAGAGEGRAPTDWSKLPAATSPDPELVPLGGRQDTTDRICARGRGDSFAKALCGGGRRAEIRDMAELLELVGLADQRAFALTGNSTSLVAMSVSAINPRILVFPRVDADLKRPDAMTAVGFVRGEPFVELVSRDPSSGDLNFYLLSFEQKCSYASGGCDLASLLTEEIEHELDRVQRLRSGRPRRHVVRLQILSPAGGGRPEAHPADAGAREPVDALVPAAVRPADRLGPRARGAVRRGAPGRRAVRRHPHRRDHERARRRQRRAARSVRARGGVRRATESVRRPDRDGDEERRQPDLAGALPGAPGRGGDRGPVPAHRRDRRGETNRRRPVVPGRGARERAARSARRRSQGVLRRRGREAQLRSAAGRRRQGGLAADVRALPRRPRQPAAEQEPASTCASWRSCRARRRISPSRASTRRPRRGCRRGAWGPSPWKASRRRPSSCRNR